jgi:hypothetical protein
LALAGVTAADFDRVLLSKRLAADAAFCDYVAMRKRLHIASIALLTCACVVAARAQPPNELDLILHYSPADSPRATGLSVDADWGASNALPETVVSEEALVFEAFGSLRHPIILDEHEGTDRGYSRLWVDLNGDGSLATNEYSDLARANAQYGEISEFTALVEDGGHRHDVTFKGHYMNFYETELRLRSMLTFTGSVHVGEEVFFVTVRDGDGDGLLIDDTFENPTFPVHMLLRSGNTNGPRRGFPLTPEIALDNECYAARLSFEGPADAPQLRMKLTRREHERGPVSFSGKGVAGVLLSTTNACLSLDVTNGFVMAPTGTWGITGIRLESGHEYSSDLYRPDTNVTITTGSTARIDAGGPLKEKLHLHGARSSGSVSFHLDHPKGVGGLAYEQASQDRTAPPGWILRRPGGTTVAEGQFEYG